ncbi:MAG: hypothetical protein QM752_05775 [Gammaproteobacteria bacterium]
MKQILLAILLLCLVPLAYAQRDPTLYFDPIEPYQYAKDFSWISGKLSYLGVGGPTWVIIYHYKKGSKFILFKKTNYLFAPPSEFQDGDMVLLGGKLIHQKKGGFIGDYYKVEKIYLLNKYNEQVKTRKR